jgi:hypothetical protein
MKIACVTGDDLLPVIDKYRDTEVWETHEPLPKLPARLSPPTPTWAWRAF